MSELPPEPLIGPPDATEVKNYLGGNSSASPEVVDEAWRAEKSAQRSVCRVPADDVEWPDALREALCRRVAHNLALRALPLGVQSAITEAAIATTRVGGTDAEVKRLEAPHRKRVLG